MKKSEKAARIQAILAELYPAPPIPLNHRDPYTLLVAVALSAQTTDKKVNQVTPLLFERAGDPYRMARLSVDEIKSMIREVGLAPQKAKALKAAAQRLVSEFGGQVPRSFEELESLAGVGHKTASVVMAQAFEVPAFPVDTHIHRLAARWGLSDGTSVTKTERDLKRIFPESRWIALHLQIIMFGREHCPARGHELKDCVICGWAASQKRIDEEAAKNRPKSKRRAANNSAPTGRPPDSTR